ncbi:putative NBD/HSP70 family sugar kinase [Melghirimyces profundicolus]|uniref:Putative NBD/HSP70 family sugar kinase n=1 Tax=Melghirimyces profundicolus TaxID=1242148 RepID=A0A2T6C0I3_9BACL|nr:ROK family protein [Melghirimyces profundicolus]PTX61829.1 putative NBD/HSP70 family sugar kinase [Melghirimyces profundicolus]
MRQHPGSSRQQIAKALGVSKNTVSLIIDRYIQSGIVRETGTVEAGNVGRPRIRLTIDSQSMTAAGILIGKKTAQYRVMDYASNVLETGEMALHGENPDTCLEEIKRLCRSLHRQYPTLLGIGIGIPGLVDPVAGVVHYSAHLGWDRTEVKKTIESCLALPVYVLNNVKAASLAWLQPAQPASSDLFYIRLGEGVGGAYIHESGVFHGSSWTAGEIGHLSVRENGPVCRCGKKGCLETLVGVPAILQVMAERAKRKFSGPKELRRFLDEPENRDRVKEVMCRLGYDLGQVLPSVIHLFNPRQIIIDSPLDRSSDFQQAIIDETCRKTLSYSFHQVEIRFVYTPHAILSGAAQAVILEYENEQIFVN